MNVSEQLQRGDLQIALARGEVLGGKDAPRQFFTTVQKGPFRNLEVTVVQGGIHRRLNDLLPEGWRLLEQEGVGLDLEGAADSKRRIIAVHSHVRKKGMVLPFFSQPHSMQIVFHEDGHIHDQLRIASVPGYTYERANNARLAQLSYQMGHAFGGATTIQDIETFVLQGEVNADTHALSVIERWREEGIDLEPGVTLETLRAWAERNQRQYRELLHRLRNGIPRDQEVDAGAF